MSFCQEKSKSDTEDRPEVLDTIDDFLDSFKQKKKSKFKTKKTSKPLPEFDGIKKLRKDLDSLEKKKKTSGKFFTGDSEIDQILEMIQCKKKKKKIKKKKTVQKDEEFDFGSLMQRFKKLSTDVEKKQTKVKTDLKDCTKEDLEVGIAYLEKTLHGIHSYRYAGEQFMKKQSNVYSKTKWTSRWFTEIGTKTMVAVKNFRKSQGTMIKMKVHIVHPYEKEILVDIGSKESSEVLKQNIFYGTNIPPDLMSLKTFEYDRINEKINDIERIKDAIDYKQYQNGKRRVYLFVKEYLKIVLPDGKTLIFKQRENKIRTVSDLMKLIQMEMGLPTDSDFYLLSCGRKLGFNEKISQLPREKEILVVLTQHEISKILSTEKIVFKLPKKYFDEKYTRDYRYLKQKEILQPWNRGGEAYYLPHGFIRYSLRVENFDMYENWNNAYHGTTRSNVESIILNGLLKRHEKTKEGKIIKIPKGHIKENVEKYGIKNWSDAIFVSPSYKYASYYSLSEITPLANGEFAILVLQVRVKPKSFEKFSSTIPEKDWQKIGENLLDKKKIEWRVTEDKGVVVYGILLKTMKTAELRKWFEKF